jgi:hypothetical protein
MKGGKLEPQQSRTATVRHTLSSVHLYGAWRAALRSEDIECSGGAMSESDRIEYDSLVVGSVVSAVAFLEAAVNELYATCADEPGDHHVKGDRQDPRFGDIGADTIRSLGALWRTASVPKSLGLLDKFQLALTLARKDPFEAGSNPYQDGALLIQLRNALIHFHPETREIALGAGKTVEPDKMARRFQGKFADSPLTPRHSFVVIGGEPHEEADWPFFPAKCLGSPCAYWACRSALSLSNDFFTRLGTTWYYHWLFDKGLIPPGMGAGTR